MKIIKKFRRTVEKRAKKDFISMVEEAWSMPFLIRLRIVWMILKGKKRQTARGMR
jgi:hypothetical protein